MDVHSALKSVLCAQPSHVIESWVGHYKKGVTKNLKWLQKRPTLQLSIYSFFSPDCWYPVWNNDSKKNFHKLIPHENFPSQFPDDSSQFYKLDPTYLIWIFEKKKLIRPNNLRKNGPLPGWYSSLRDSCKNFFVLELKLIEPWWNIFVRIERRPIDCK